MLWRLGETCRFGWRCYLHEYPPRILALTTLPRVLLQSLFFVWLGGLSTGPAGEEFALIGAAATTMTLFTAVSICDVPRLEEQSATFYRHRLAVVNPFAAFVIRGTPHVIGGCCAAVVTLGVVGSLTGHLSLMPRIASALPVYALMAITASAAGLAIAILTVPSSNDTLASNVLAYLLLIGSGAIIPAERTGVFGDLGALLPMHHGIASVRAIVNGQPWLGELVAEIAVGAAWAFVCWAALRLRVQRARSHGAEEFS